MTYRSCPKCGGWGYWHYKNIGDEKQPKYVLVNDSDDLIHPCYKQQLSALPNKVYCMACMMYFRSDCVCSHLKILGWDENNPLADPFFFFTRKLESLHKSGKSTNEIFNIDNFVKLKTETTLSNTINEISSL